MSALSALKNITEEEAERALSFVPAHDRDVWVKMAMAIKSEFGEEGRDIWWRWSQSDESFDARDARDVWKSVKMGGKTTIGTLIDAAKRYGFEFDTGNTVSEDEMRARRERVKAEAEREKAEAERRAAEVAVLAAEIWDEASPASEHPYLSRKGISHCAGRVRVGAWRRWYNGGTIEIHDALIIPARRADSTLMTLQGIFPNADNPLGRDRDYLPGGAKSGCYFTIGKPAGDEFTIVVCEGYATGCTIHDVTGFAVVVAFDRSNIWNVTRSLRERFEKAHIIIAADDDWQTSGNPGLKDAKKAAAEFRCAVAIPDFSDADERQPKETDFNDMFARCGAGAVRDVFNKCLRVRSPLQLEEQTTNSQRAANDNSPLDESGRLDPNRIDWEQPFPHMNSSGKPLSTIKNLEWACKILMMNVRYNIIKKEIELIIPGESYTIDNEANASRAWLVSALNQFRMPTGNVDEYLTYLGEQNLFNPVATWITSKQWDGQSRLQDVLDTVVTSGEMEGNEQAAKLKYVLMKKWMISAVAAAFLPNGVSAHGVLVFRSEQNLGKTHWFRSLVPKELGITADGITLDPSDRDSVKKVISNWMVELGELDSTFRKSDISALKAFLTKDEDIMRTAYARKESKFARRTVFFASVNDIKFLSDPTGNRRYWTLDVVELNHLHGIDMQQVWAEVYEDFFLKNETWFLSNDEMRMLNDSNEDYEVVDPVSDRLSSRYDWDAPEPLWRWMTSSDIVTEMGYEKPSRSDVITCGQYLHKKRHCKRKRSNGRQLTLVPPLIQQAQQVSYSGY